jgi:DNA-binding transcriptional ArsR family regulator
LVEITESGISNVSQQLKMMWMAGYISKERRGKQVVYSLADDRVAQAIDVLESLYPRERYPDGNGCADE